MDEAKHIHQSRKRQEPRRNWREDRDVGTARGVKGCGDVTPGNGHRQLWPPTKIDLPTSTPDGKIDDPAAASNFTALAQCFNRRLGGAWRHEMLLLAVLGQSWVRLFV